MPPHVAAQHSGRMSITSTIERHGGWATWTDLRASHSKRAIAVAVDAGTIVRRGRGRYVTPVIGAQLAAAVEAGGLLSHTSAALRHGWKVKVVPEVAHVTIPRSRGRRRSVPPAVRLHHADVPDGEHVDRVTAPLRTVVDCARLLPFDEALAVADSALRHRAVSRRDLRTVAAEAKGPRARAVRRVAAHADGRAANPLESVLRALAIEEGMRLTPQLVVAEPGLFGAADLGSEQLRLVIEAEGYATHGTRRGLRRDCRRHALFAAFGWDSLRFAYEDVMHEPDWVRWVLRSWQDTRAGRVPGSPPRPRG